MKSNITDLLLIIVFGLFLTACSKSAGSITNVNPPDYHVDDLPPADNSTPKLTIAWDSTGKKISHSVGYAEYGRIHRLSGDTLILTYHCGPNSSNFYGDDIAVRWSYDNGDTWGNTQIVVKNDKPDYYGFANPEILVMQNGWILLAYVGRGKPDDNIHDNVQVIISKDRGKTWGVPIIAAQGRSWEPGLIQLPDGEIEMFYSSEAAWWPGNNPLQEILMISSTDNGHTWSNPMKVSFSNGNRDGMPVPLVLKGNKGIVFAIESVGNAHSPWIIWSSMDANWNYASYGTTGNSRRWLATSENIWGGAPYLVQLPDGNILLSVQDSGGRTIGSDWKKNTMLVLVGNSVARNFTNISYPWPDLPTNEGAYFSSLFLKNDTTVIAVTSRNFPDGHSEIWSKEGKIHN